MANSLDGEKNKNAADSAGEIKENGTTQSSDGKGANGVKSDAAGGRRSVSASITAGITGAFNAIRGGKRSAMARRGSTPINSRQVGWSDSPQTPVSDKPDAESSQPKPKRRRGNQSSSADANAAQKQSDGENASKESDDYANATTHRRHPQPKRRAISDVAASNETKKQLSHGNDATNDGQQHASDADADKAAAMSDAVDRKRHRTKRDRSFSLKKSTSQAYSDTKQKISTTAHSDMNIFMKILIILWTAIKFLFRLIGYFFRSIWRFLVVIAVMFVSIGTIGLLAVFYLFTTTIGEIPSLQDYTQMSVPQDSTIYDVDGEVIGIISTVKSSPVAFSEIDQKAKDAIVSIEDERFYDHEGVDLIGIARAIKANYDSWRSGGSATSQGGSTITQQYVRGAYEGVGTEQTVTRKLTEIMLSVELEATMSKDDILNSYLNTVYYGNGVYGIEAASQYYFGHSCKELSYYEAAVLAAIPNGPSIYNPATEDGIENTADRASIVLDRMYSLGKLGDMTQEELRELKQTDIKSVIHISDEGRTINQPFYYDYVMRELQKDYSTDEITSGGWQVYTTLSIKDGEEATDIVKKIEDRYSTSDGLVTSTIVDINVEDGSINAFCGGTDYEASQFNAAVDGRLQNGSTMKPFLYAEMIEEFGYYTTDRLNCSPIDVAGEGEKPHIIDSYLGGGKRTMEDGIIQSDNAMAVRAAQEIGMDNVEKMLKACGATNDLDDNVIAMIGGQQQGYTPLEMANVYATLANQGQMNKAWCIRSITDNYGNVVYEHEDAPQYAMSKETALQITQSMVKAVDKRPEWYNIPFDRNGGWTIAAKSGTTDDRTDLWCCGFDKQHAVSVWIGGRDAKVEVPTTTPTACKTLSDYFYTAHDDDKKEDFEKPQFKTTVPKLNDGETLDSYIERINKLRLHPSVQYVSDTNHESGTIIGVENAGKLIERGDDVIIDIAQDMVVVPDFKSMSPSDVYANSDGLSVTWQVEYSTSGSTDPKIIDQTLDAGSVVRQGTAIKLTVQIVSPRVDGDSEQVPYVGSDDAMSKLKSERDDLSDENEKQKEQIEQLQQQLDDYAANTNENINETLGGDANENENSNETQESDMVEIPNITDLSVSDGRRVLLSLGLNLDIDTTDYSKSVTGTMPSAGESVEKGTTVEIITDGE